MTVRTFLFCDLCNTQGIRYVEQRRNSPRDTAGKRISDGRAWLEVDIDVAVAQYGWVVTETNKHLCPLCAERLKRNPALDVP